MDKSTQIPAVRTGVDLSKRVTQVHAVDAGGRALCNRALIRDKSLTWRSLLAMALDAGIVWAHLAAPYRSEGHVGKNDANDAAAICEAASRPHTRFVPVKSIEQQSLLCVHRLRQGVKADRTACINRIRGLLPEFGLAVPNGARALRLVLDETLEDGANAMNGVARMTIGRHRHGR